MFSWPPQSPDLNLIETLWAIVKQKVASLIPKNKNKHKENIRKAYESIPKETCEKFFMSFKDVFFYL